MRVGVMGQDTQAEMDDLIRELSAEIGQVYRWMADQAGINQTDLMSLYFIRNAEEPATPKRLAEHLGLTSGATAILLNRLEARGYIQRSPHPTDRRGVLLALGPAVQSQDLLHLRQRFHAMNSDVIAAFLPEELAIVQRFMRSLLLNTQDSLRRFRTGEAPAATPDDAAR